MEDNGMRRLIAATTMVLLGALVVPGTAAATQGCVLVAPTNGSVLYKGDTYHFVAKGCQGKVKGHLATQVVFEAPMSQDAAVDSRGEWSTDYVVDDYALSLNMTVWVRFADGSRSNSAQVTIAART
jgi:hypothetical protein